MKVFHLITLTNSTRTDMIANQVLKVGNIEIFANAMQRFLNSLMTNSMGCQNNVLNATGGCWNKDTAPYKNKPSTKDQLEGSSCAAN